jgi:D-alanyl-lipoteichoic acid acyltransferase DltB (MBOAT superfamily)
MLFNSLSFLIFFVIVYLLYWKVFKYNLKWQNIMLLLASYYFYGCWDWRFLILLTFSTLLDFFTGLKIYQTDNEKIRKLWLVLFVGINLGFLGVFKYYNFFALSFANLFNSLGFQINPGLLQLILPVGISFYTFHGLSYIFDVYKRKILPSENFVNYSLFVSFFPLLVAGPIERATHLLPQIELSILNRIKKICKQKHVKLLLLVNTPIFQAEKYTDINYYYSFCNKNNDEFTFLDFSRFNPGKSGFADISHLNQHGARIFSKFLYRKLGNNIGVNMDKVN